MPLGCGHFSYRTLVLRICRLRSAEKNCVLGRMLSAFINKPRRHLQIFFVLCVAVKLNESKLDFLMTGRVKRYFVLIYKYFFYMIGITADYTEQLVLAGRLIIGYRRLNQMPEAVELMTVTQLEFCVRLQSQIKRVVISVLVGVFFDEIDNIVNYFFKALILFVSCYVCDAFDPFCNIGIPKKMRFVWVAVLPVAFKGIKASGIRKAVIYAVNRNLTVELLPCAPKAAQLNIIKRYLSHRSDRSPLSLLALL